MRLKTPRLSIIAERHSRDSSRVSVRIMPMIYTYSFTISRYRKAN